MSITHGKSSYKNYNQLESPVYYKHGLSYLK